MSASSRPVRIKICGLRRPEDVETCLQLEVDWLGFNFWPGSKRYVAPAEARSLVAMLPPEVRAVGVFVNASPKEIAEIVDHVRLTCVQLHGDERIEDYAELPVQLIQVVRVSGSAPLRADRISPRADEVLLDAAVAGYGGAGAQFDWAIAEDAQRTFGRKVMLAGGLTPMNVTRAVKDVAPAGVDVASGVESAPGVKDPEKLKAFVRAVRAAAGVGDDT